MGLTTSILLLFLKPFEISICIYGTHNFTFVCTRSYLINYHQNKFFCYARNDEHDALISLLDNDAQSKFTNQN